MFLSRVTLSGFYVVSMIMAIITQHQAMGGMYAQCDQRQTLISSSSSIMSISSRAAIMSILSLKIRSQPINISVCWSVVTTLVCCHNVISCHITWPMSCSLSYHSDVSPIKLTYYPQDGTCTRITDKLNSQRNSPDHFSLLSVLSVSGTGAR